MLQRQTKRHLSANQTLIRGQFQQHFKSVFAPIFLRQKKFKPKMQVQKSFTQNKATRKIFAKLTQG
jgi:hypothetical protein